MQNEIELTDYAGIIHFGRNATGCGPTWRAKPFVFVCACVCVWDWKCEPVSIRVSIVQQVTWESSSSQFTLNLSSANHSRGLEDPVSKVALSKVISSCRRPQDGGSANFRGNTRISFFFMHFGVYWTHSVAGSICNQNLWNPFINAEAFFFLLHTWAKLWMRCYLFTPCWAERCALLICSDRIDSRVGHGPGKTLKERARSNKHVARDLSSHAHANTISSFSSNPQPTDDMVYSRKQNDIQAKLVFLLIITVMCLCCCSVICRSDFQPLFKNTQDRLSSLKLIRFLFFFLQSWEMISGRRRVMWWWPPVSLLCWSACLHVVTLSPPCPGNATTSESAPRMTASLWVSSRFKIKRSYLTSYTLLDPPWCAAEFTSKFSADFNWISRKLEQMCVNRRLKSHKKRIMYSCLTTVPLCFSCFLLFLWIKHNMTFNSKCNLKQQDSDLVLFFLETQHLLPTSAVKEKSIYTNLYPFILTIVSIDHKI